MTKQPDYDAVRNISDRIAIQDVISAVTLHSDLNEFDRVLALYTPGAVIDYSGVSGPESANIPVEQHRQNLLGFLPGFDQRQHQTTNFQISIDGDTAASRAQVRAIHILDGAIWLVHGTYHHRLERSATGWLITYQRADVVHQEGAHLVAAARQRVQDRAGAGKN